MAPLGHHIRLRLLDDRVIATTVEERRLLARIVLQQGRRCNLVAMALAESHLHIEALCDRIAAGRLAHGIEASLKQRLRLPVGFVQYTPEPIRDHRHLRNTFKYTLTQHERHGFRMAVMLEASNVPDLLGMRLLGRYTLANVRRWLPAVRRSDILSWMSLSELEPADGPLELLEDATLAAACLNDLCGRSPAVVTARRAMLEIIGRSASGGAVAQRFGIALRTQRWL